MSHARVYKIRSGTKQTSFVSLTVASPGMPWPHLFSETLFAELIVQDLARFRRVRFGLPEMGTVNDLL
jgi:hypothetical protein